MTKGDVNMKKLILIVIFLLGCSAVFSNDRGGALTKSKRSYTSISLEESTYKNDREGAL